MFEKRLIVMPEQTFRSKDEVLEYMTHLENDKVSNPDGYAKDVRDREATFATYTFDGIAIPHAKSENVTEPFIAYARLNEAVHWGDDEGEDAIQVFLLGVPKSGNNLHLELLTRLSKKLVHEDFRKSLADASSTEEVYQLLKKFEEELTV